MTKKVRFVLYSNGAPEARFSNTTPEIYCACDCDHECADVKDCIYPPKFKSFLEENFPEYDVKLNVRYQGYHNDCGTTTIEKDELRVDAELMKKNAVNYMEKFIKDIVIPTKVPSL